MANCEKHLGCPFDEWSGRLCIGLQNQTKGFDSPTRFKLLVINLKNKNNGKRIKG